MKHKVKGSTHAEFCALWASFFNRLKETGETIVKAKFKFDDMNHFVGFSATVWTEHKERKEVTA